MKLNLIYLLTLISNLTFGQISSDTITNWQIYKDSKLILAGNETRKNAMLPITTIELQDTFKYLRINFIYDFYSGDIKREIDFYLEDQQIGKFKNKGAARESILIPKKFIDKTFKNYQGKIILIQYSDNKYNSKGIPIGMIIFSK